MFFAALKHTIIERLYEVLNLSHIHTSVEKLISLKTFVFQKNTPYGVDSTINEKWKGDKH